MSDLTNRLEASAENVIGNGLGEHETVAELLVLVGEVVGLNTSLGDRHDII
jgi:hypothetical protein